MRYCGRDFSEYEMTLIRKIISFDAKRKRAEISRLVCKDLNWYKPDGGLKDMSCRVALLRMEKDGLIKLPPPQNGNGNGKNFTKRTIETNPKPEITHPAGYFQNLRAELVKTKTESALWNEYMDRYHYLGFKALQGAQLRYIIKSENEILSLLGFGASAWKVAPRDHFIGWTHEQRKKGLHLIVNNARFLILPWVQSKNLASKILSIVIKRIQGDWKSKYNYCPLLLETFVECDRFQGTCYKAVSCRNHTRSRKA